MAAAGKLLQPTIQPRCLRSSSSFARRRSSASAPFSGFESSKLQKKILPVAITPLKAALQKGSVIQADEDGVSLGTMMLPPNTDIARFEDLLFQWANSLCQGANLPLPAPLKVDKVEGGVRLGFIEIDDGKTEVLVYIDCLVSPATGSSAPIFRAIRNGPLKDQAPPGEPRIMRSLLQALKKSVEIAKM